MQKFQLQQNLMASFTTTKHHWCQLEKKSSYMENQDNTLLGHLMENRGGTLDLHQNTTDSGQYM